MKYPRTHHLPYSPGATKDDKKLHDGWFSNYIGEEIVITAKLDGENIHMTQKDCYARSDGAPTRSPWSRNIWDPQDGLYWRIKQYIGDNETIFGENLYGEHSIHYNKLTDYFHLFAVNDGVNWYSWDDVKMMADIMNIPHVPELWRGIVYKEEDLQKLVEKYVHESEWYGKYVCKWVRKDHVTTDEHWTKNWKKAELNLEI